MVISRPILSMWRVCEGIQRASSAVTAGLGTVSSRGRFAVGLYGGVYVEETLERSGGGRTGIIYSTTCLCSSPNMGKKEKEA